MHKLTLFAHKLLNGIVEMVFLYCQLSYCVPLKDKPLGVSCSYSTKINIYNIVNLLFSCDLCLRVYSSHIALDCKLLHVTLTLTFYGVLFCHSSKTSRMTMQMLVSALEAWRWNSPSRGPVAILNGLKRTNTMCWLGWRAKLVRRLLIKLSLS